MTTELQQTLVIGGTGAMGGRVVRRLLRHQDIAVRVLTRDLDSERARALSALGQGRVHLVQGDLDDEDSVRRATAGVDRVFCNTDFMSSGSALAEYRQGLAVLEAARAAGVDRFIWSSLDSAVGLTAGEIPVPHYDAKAAVAAHINLMRSEEMMQKQADGWYGEHVSILTTAPYFENFQTALGPQPGRLADGRDGVIFHLPMGDGTYPLIGLDDIAWYADHMFGNWHEGGAKDLAVIGDGLTGREIAAAFERVTQVPAEYASVPLDVLRNSIPDIGHDFAAMFRFFQERNLLVEDRDISALRARHPALMTFEDWLRATGWRGEQVDVHAAEALTPA